MIAVSVVNHDDEPQPPEVITGVNDCTTSDWVNLGTEISCNVDSRVKEGEFGADIASVWVLKGEGESLSIDNLELLVLGTGNALADWRKTEYRLISHDEKYKKNA